MNIRRQVRRAEERKQEKADRQLARQLELSDFTYEATDENMTFSAMGPQLVDFMRVIVLLRHIALHIMIKTLPSKLRSDGGYPAGMNPPSAFSVVCASAQKIGLGTRAPSRLYTSTPQRYGTTGVIPMRLNHFAW